MQNKLMKFDPATNDPKPYPSHAEQYREWHGQVAWLYNPWTGSMRDPRDIGTDVFGLLIRVDGEALKAEQAQQDSNLHWCGTCEQNVDRGCGDSACQYRYKLPPAPMNEVNKPEGE